MKEGYQSTKKELKVVKKKPNILDKMPVKKTASSGSKDSSPSPPGSPLPPPGMTPEQAQKMEDLITELNKLKAIVLKHEVRIRDLEKMQNNSAGNDEQIDNEKNDMKNNGDA